MTATDTDSARPGGRKPEEWKPEIGPDGKVHLPGLTLVFFIILCGFGALFILDILWAFPKLMGGESLLENNESEAVASAGRTAFTFMILLGLLGAFLCWRTGKAIYLRETSAPARCCFLLTLYRNICILGLFSALLLVVFTDMGQSLFKNLDMKSGLPFIFGDMLPSIVMAEAWRRYFLISPKVRQVFLPLHPAEHGAEVPPAEIGIFMAACWLCLAKYGLPNLVSTLYSFDIIAAGGALFLIFKLMIAISHLALPYAALQALRIRWGMFHIIFWCLGLWLAVEAFIWLFTAGSLFEVLPQADKEYTYSLPATFSERLFIPLAFWWYFSVSQKARAWFGAERLPWEGEAARF